MRNWKNQLLAEFNSANSRFLFIIRSLHIAQSHALYLICSALDRLAIIFMKRHGLGLELSLHM